MEHISVLLDEAIEALKINENGIYVDATFGRGGHSKKILEHLSDQGRLIVFDKDIEAIQVAKKIAEKDHRLTVVHSGFGDLKMKLNELGIHYIDGILLDLGISSPQVDTPDRGFSFRFDAPLDMRMDTSKGITAAEWINCAEENEIAEVIKEYGEERFSKRIARSIVAKRLNTPISSTKELADLVSSVIRLKEKGQHPATRTFQAIRIKVNNELEEIKSVLLFSIELLKEKGRLVVISFHSLEDRLVKQFMNKQSKLKNFPKWVLLKETEMPLPPLKIIGKAIRPSSFEVEQNKRSRSATLRVSERTMGVLSE